MPAGTKATFVPAGLATIAPISTRPFLAEPLVLAGPAPNQLQTGHRFVGAGLVGLLHHEAHVNDHPVARRERFFRQHADVDLAVLADDVDQGDLVVVAVEHPDALAGYPQTHRSNLSYPNFVLGAQQR